LKHVIERACVLCQDGVLQVKHLPLDLHRPAPQRSEPASQSLHPDLRNAFSEPVRPTFQYQSEEEQLRNALLYANNNKAKAAKILGVSRSTLYRWMERYNIAE
jgi:transcriptional regulator of acetoin/glycerol metabolism